MRGHRGEKKKEDRYMLCFLAFLFLLCLPRIIVAHSSRMMDFNWEGEQISDSMMEGTKCLYIDTFGSLQVDDTKGEDTYLIFECMDYQSYSFFLSLSLSYLLLCRCPSPLRTTVQQQQQHSIQYLQIVKTTTTTVAAASRDVIDLQSKRSTQAAISHCPKSFTRLYTIKEPSKIIMQREHYNREHCCIIIIIIDVNKIVKGTCVHPPPPHRSGWAPADDSYRVSVNKKRTPPSISNSSKKDLSFLHQYYI